MIYDRFNAVEGNTVRLYFRNYVGNVLRQPDTTPVCTITPKGAASPKYTPTVFQGSVPGEFYVEWAIPSSSTGSLKYSPTFTGPGNWQDSWTVVNSSITTVVDQDFYVYPDKWNESLSAIFEPLQLVHTLETPRFEVGAKDYVVWRIKDINGKLIVGQSKFPEGQIRLKFGDQVVYNYSNLIHKNDSDIYRWFLDTSSLTPGIYKLQTKFIVEGGTNDTEAFVVSDKSLANGWQPTSDGLLSLTIDGISRTISFPTTATNAKISGTLNELIFRDAGNDVFIVNSNDTEYSVRLLNTDTARTITNIVEELKGIPPTSWSQNVPTGFTGMNYPIVTSYIKHNSLPSVNGKTLTVDIDGQLFTTTFNGITSISDIINQINSVLPSTVKAEDCNGIIAIGNISSVSTITIVSGSSLNDLGFVENQSDNSTHAIVGVNITDNGGVLKLEGQGGTSLQVLSSSAGSTANLSLGFDASGESDVGNQAQGAIFTGNTQSFPIIVKSGSSAIVESAIDISDFKPNNTYPYNTPLHNTSFDLTISGYSTVTVDFGSDSNRATVGAITSTLNLGVFDNIVGKSLIISNGTSSATVTFSTGSIGNNSLTLNEVISQINSQIASLNLAADTWNGRLRIRSTSIGIPVKIDTSSTSLAILGFNNIDTNPENYFQNDQIYFDGTNYVAEDYIQPWTLSQIVNLINSYYTGIAPASLNGNKIRITHPTPGSTNTIQLSDNSGTPLSLLSLPTGTFTGEDPLQNSFSITEGFITETITLSEKSAKSLVDIINDINSQSGIVTASDYNGYLRLISINTGSSTTVTLNDVTSGTLAALGFTDGQSESGIDQTIPTITASNSPSTNFASGGNATLVIIHGDVASPTKSIIDLSTVTSETQLLNAINTNISANAIASIASGVLTIEANNSGSQYLIAIGGLNDGSNANATLGFSVDGAQEVGTDGIPYTLQQIIDRINASYGGFIVAEDSSNFLRIKSIEKGASAQVKIGNSTTPNILNDWGLAVGTYVGTTETVVPQVIISEPKTFVIGE